MSAVAQQRHRGYGSGINPPSQTLFSCSLFEFVLRPRAQLQCPNSGSFWGVMSRMTSSSRNLVFSVPLAHLGGPAKCNWARLTCTKPPKASRSSLGRLLEDSSSSLAGPESTIPISLPRVPKRDVQIAWRPWESIKGCLSDGTLLCFFHTTSSMLAEPSLPRPGTHPYLLLDLRPL
jgi:hypothetical protein